MSDRPAAAAPDLAEARRRLRADDREAAETLLRAALAAHPDDAEALHLLAVARLGAGEVAEALALAERAVAAGATALSLNTLGSLRLRTGDGAGARRAFEDALALDPDLVEARLNLADALLAGDETEAAEAHYRTVLVSLNLHEF